MVKVKSKSRKVKTPNRKQIELLSTLFNQKRYLEAAGVAQQITERFPEHGFGWMIKGILLRQEGRAAEGLAAMERAAALMPNDPDVQNNMGVYYTSFGKIHEAETCFRKSIKLNPEFAEAHYNLGANLRTQNRLVEAEPAYRRAIRYKSDHVDAHNNLGNVLALLGRLNEAETSYRQALELNPDYLVAHSNLIFTSNYSATRSPTEIFEEHRQYNQHFAKNVPGNWRYQNGTSEEVDGARRLRIGYVSQDFRQHSVACFLKPLLREHDSAVVEIFCYAGVREPDAVTLAMQELSDHWLNTTGLSDRALADRIAADRIDILVDLAGHTAGNRLPVFALKPAPIQVTWLGYPNTTGLLTMDYRLVDAITDPPCEADQFASETLIRMDNGFLCYDPPLDAPMPSKPPSLKSGHVTFGSFNNPAKLSAATLDVWAALLRQLPASRLLVKGKIFKEAESRASFLLKMQERGIDGDRITLLGFVDGLTHHLAMYEQIDIALDPFPYNGTTTTLESLWMGVPVVTLVGNRHAARVGASILSHLGLEELIAIDSDEYINRAATLAGDLSRLRELRETIRQTLLDSPLCDAKSFATKMESVFQNLWRQYCASVGRGLCTR